MAIGDDLALGAGKGRMTLLILSEASLLALIGLGIGVGGSLLVGRTMQTTLYRMGKMDPRPVRYGCKFVPHRLTWARIRQQGGQHRLTP